MNQAAPNPCFAVVHAASTALRFRSNLRAVARLDSKAAGSMACIVASGYPSWEFEQGAEGAITKVAGSRTLAARTEYAVRFEKLSMSMERSWVEATVRKGGSVFRSFSTL